MPRPAKKLLLPMLQLKRQSQKLLDWHQAQLLMLLKNQKLRQQHLEFQDLETIHLQLAKEWVFLVLWQDLATIHLMQLKAWQDRALQDQVHHVLEQDPRVEHQDQVAQDQVAQEAHVQDLVLQNQEWVVELPVVFRVVHQLVVEVAELAAVPQVHLEKAEQEVKAKLESQSALREKNSNKEAFQALVEQLFQEEMATQSSDCAVEHQFRTSQTRLMPMLVS
jgi:hypothetical protein